MMNNINITGAILSKKDVRDYTRKIGGDFPLAFQLRKMPIKSQGKYPTCTAHALASAVEYHTQIESGKYYRYSTNFIYGNRNDKLYKTEGMSLRDGLNILKNYGDVLYDSCPGNSYAQDAKSYVQSRWSVWNLEDYSPSRITAYYKINTLEELQTAIYNDGPVIATMRIYDDYELVNNVYKFNIANDFSYHAVLIVGWTQDCLIMQNSWSSLWGKQGYCFIKISDIDKVFAEFYGITDNINTVIRPNKVIKKTSIIWNFILNLLTKISSPL